MWLRTWAFVTCFALGGAGTAAAVCRQANLTGTWDLYAAQNGTFESDGGGNDLGVLWSACTVRITVNGIIRPGTGCTNSFGEQIAISGGILILARSCRATGQLNVRTGSAPMQLRIPRATLTAGKELLVGVADNPLAGPFIFQAVKR